MTNKYPRLLGIFYKNILINELEYRVNFLSNLVLSVFWLVWAALSVRVYFYHAETIAGWSYAELLIVMGLFFALNGYRQMILEPNLSRLSEYIRMGTLDYVLMKPVDSQFLISLRNIGVFNWGDPLLGLGLVGYALWWLDYLPGVSETVLFLMLTVTAAVVLYSFSLILQTTTFWLVNIEEADTVVQSVLEAGRFPIAFYRGWVRAVLTFVVPVAFLTTFPAQALLGQLGWQVSLGAVAMALFLFVAATAFWRFALRYYTGASA